MKRLCYLHLTAFLLGLGLNERDAPEGFHLNTVNKVRSDFPRNFEHIGESNEEPLHLRPSSGAGSG